MSTAVVRDLRLVSDRALADVINSSRLAWASWVTECFSAEHSWEPSFDVQHAAETTLALPEGAWQAHGEHGEPSPVGWSLWSERGRQQLAARLVQRASPTAALLENDWALAAADLAWARLTEKLLGPLISQPNHALAKPDGRAWSATVLISEPSLDAHWALCLPPTLEPVAPSIAETQCSVLDCVGQRSLRIHVDLGEVDITLADLLALQVGDVVRFPAVHGQGVPFRLGETNRIAGLGQLGLIDGHLALRLSSSSSVRS